MHYTTIFSIVAVLALSHLGGQRADAWSYKEHVALTRLAALRLIEDPTTSPALRDWLAEHVAPEPIDQQRRWFIEARVGINPDPAIITALSYAVLVPDIEAGRRDGPPRPPFDRHERLMHYIDLEFFNADPAANAFLPNLSARPAVDALPRDPADPRYTRGGFLPFAVTHARDELVSALRQRRDRDSVKWAGYLLHYAQDNTQPHHATEDYKSHSYFNDRVDAPNVHAMMEWRAVDDQANPEPFVELRAALWDRMIEALKDAQDPESADDPFLNTLRVAWTSYAALPMIGRAAVAASDDGRTLDVERFFAHHDELDGVPMTVAEMKSRQLAWAVLRSETHLRAAWAASEDD
jgi:hypothetical protein